MFSHMIQMSDVMNLLTDSLSFLWYIEMGWPGTDGMKRFHIIKQEALIEGN